MTNTNNPTSFKSNEKATWCPGCGHFSALSALDKALQALGLPKHKVAIISGIGCSSRMPFFLDVYGLHSAHGRALPVATGLKLSRPDLNVIAVGGDGDALAIGAGHFLHAMRRNLDLTYLLLDNQTYGMTKGQTAPTSMIGTKTKSTPYGSFENPIDPVWAALTLGATFVAQGCYSNLNQLVQLLIEGIKHPGTSVVNVISNCVTFYPHLTKDYLETHTEVLPENYNPHDISSAIQYMMHPDRKMPLGVIYHNPSETPIDQKYKELLAKQTSTDQTLSAHNLINELL